MSLNNAIITIIFWLSRFNSSISRSLGSGFFMFINLSFSSWNIMMTGYIVAATSWRPSRMADIHVKLHQRTTYLINSLLENCFIPLEYRLRLSSKFFVEVGVLQLLLKVKQFFLKILVFALQAFNLQHEYIFAFVPFAQNLKKRVLLHFNML